MKVVCVVNPVSGKGKGKSVALGLQQVLEERGHEVWIIETSPDSDWFIRSCQIIDLDTRVVCIGGAGTLLYFLNHWDSYHSVAFFGVGT